MSVTVVKNLFEKTLFVVEKIPRALAVSELAPAREQAFGAHWARDSAPARMSELAPQNLALPLTAALPPPATVPLEEAS